MGNNDDNFLWLTLKNDFYKFMPLPREELREAMVNFGTRCTDEWVFSIWIWVSGVQDFALNGQYVKNYSQKVTARLESKIKNLSALGDWDLSLDFPFSGSLCACSRRPTRIKTEELILKSSRQWCCPTAKKIENIFENVDLHVLLLGKINIFETYLY